MSAVHSALVIGGGIAGPVAATALRAAGIDARVYEAYPGPAFGIGGALALEPNGLAALEIIGAADAVRAASTPISRSIMSVTSTKSVEIPGLADLPPRRAIDRGDLHRALHDTAVAAGVPFEYNKRLVDVEEGADGITARFTDGSTATADVLIGADGIRSTVRRLIDPQAPGPNYQGMLSFSARVDGTGLDVTPDAMTFAFGKRAYYLYWPMPDGTVLWGANLPWQNYLSLTDARTIPSADWLARLRETYAGDDPGETLIARTTPETLVVSGALHIMPSVPHWHRGRMTLVGDAVHAPSNSTGQGASLSIESGIELARCLRDEPDVTSAFTAYERVRRERVETITARGARTGKLKTPGPVARSVMHLLMPLAFKAMNMEKIMGREQRYRVAW
jgi:2-polyprenyl-6-methoxyphenol hydroxylase-like FAD-dependent oxidoreductase